MMYMTPAVNTGENYTGLSATQTDDVEEQYDDIIAVAAKNGQVQPASNGDSYKGSTVGQLATALRAEILRARRMRLFVLTVIIVTFVIAVAALVLVVMKMADGEGSAAPKQETKAPVTFRAVFTNLGASGRLPPTSLGSYYSGQDHDGQVTLVSGIQRWTVPYTGDYRIEAVGAAGGYDTGSNGGIFRGRGARMEGTFNLSQGETIQILVGQEGGINNVTTSAGGGGGTFVVMIGNKTPLIVAGGGGGVNYSNTRYTGCDATTATIGRTGHLSLAGGGGGLGSETGQSTNLGGGGGGFYTSGRSSTQFGGSNGTGGEGGRGFIQGGIGGRSWLKNVVGGFGGGGGAYGSGGGGGGGGGYSGGGSGKGLPEACGGGGGSYNAGKNQQNECCYNAAGHGQMHMTPGANEEYYSELQSTKNKGNVEQTYENILGEAVTNVKVQTARNANGFKEGMKPRQNTTTDTENVLRQEIMINLRRMKLFMLTAITLTFLVAVVALVLVAMKMADGESSAPPKQETKVQDQNADDCVASPQLCDANAVCENIAESNICICKPGFAGNGKICADLNECTMNTHNCNANNYCNNTLGSFTCTCKLGFSGNGTSCTDINECSRDLHSCDAEKKQCVNTVGSYKCECKAGYQGDGKTCIDIDECASGVHACHKNASCINTEGSYKCSCKNPYTGDGNTCNLAAECQTFHNLTSKDRSETYSANTSGCDSGIGPGWYRFRGAAGTRMPTSCPPTRRCNTNAPGWINGTHPVVADGQVSKTVCFHWENDCCRFSTNIQVRNCGPYYVYFFSGTPGSICFLRYCGTE